MTALLSFDQVAKSHWRGAHEIPVLLDVSFTLAAGEFVAVWGSRGSGKTTLTRLAVGREKPDRGTVRFRDSPVEFPADLHRDIGWARRAGPKTEDFRDVASYLSFPLIGTTSRRTARRRAIAILERFGVADCASVRWHELTDGQQTPVAIAHALVREPSLLVIDDPTASLDLLQREEVMRALRIACDEDRIGILVTVPDMPSGHVDRLAMLSDSQLVFPTPKDPLDNVVDFPDQQSA
jgi:putative ABC transport system ATP-binding protein